MTIGPLLSGKTVRDAAEATLKLWLPSVLAEIETAYDLDDGTLKVPAEGSYYSLARVNTLIATEQRPAVLLATTGKQLHRKGNGTYDATFALAVRVIAGGLSFEHTVDQADYYAVAVETALSQHPSLAAYEDDPVAEATWPLGTTYEPIGEGDRTVMTAVVEFGVRVSDVLDATAGPLEPPPAEWAFPADITETEIIVERMEA